MDDFKKPATSQQIWFNMDEKLLPHGGRKAQKGTIMQLRRIIEAALPEGYYIGSAIYEIKTFSRLEKDLSKINVDFENFIEDGYVLSDSGVPYLRCIIGGDWELPVCGMLYWDGKAIRGYLPEYGNSFNPKTRTAFGSEEDSTADPTGDYDVVVGGTHKTMSFSSLDKLRKFFLDNMEIIVPNQDACAQAFSARVVANGELTDEAVEKVCKKFRKVAEEFE